MYEDSARRYRNKDDARVVEIDLQIIVDEYSKKVELFRKANSQKFTQLDSIVNMGLRKRYWISDSSTY